MNQSFDNFLVHPLFEPELGLLAWLVECAYPLHAFGHLVLHVVFVNLPLGAVQEVEHQLRLDLLQKVFFPLYSDRSFQQVHGENSWNTRLANHLSMRI